MEMTGAQVLVRGLEAEGVEVIYGYPGGAIMPVYDALIGSPIKNVLVRHEQAAAHAADGYARSSGKVGVCMATSGPGATNLVTGIATAYMDSVPLVVLTGQVSSNMVGTDAFQEVDITGITHPITKHSYLVQDVNEIPRIIKEAFYIASTGRPGPVLIDLPKNVADSICTAEVPEKVALPGYKPTLHGHSTQIKNACQEIRNAKRPMIQAGGGVIIADAAEELLKFAEMLQIPVATTLMGMGSMPTEHELFLGMIGIHGSTTANKAVSEADLLITIGARFDDRVTSAVNKFAPEARIIHIDIDPAEIGKNIRVNVPIVGDVKLVLQAIIKQMEPVERPDWLKKIHEWKNKNGYCYPDAGGKMTTRRVLKSINEYTKGEAFVTTDVGQHQMFAAQFVRLNHARSFITSGGLGTMGYGFPAAIGAQMANPQATVVCVSGDGSFQMNLQELATAQEQKLPIKIFIFNNNCLGMVRQLQDFYCDSRQTGVRLTGNPDFVKLAEAYGFKGYRINQVSQINEVLEKVFSSDELVIVEAVIDSDEFVYPTVLSGKGLNEMIIGGGGSDEE